LTGTREHKTREKILIHARRLFSERGFHKVTVEELCAGLGLSKRTFYRHFRDRETLVEELVEGLFAQFGPQVLENLHSNQPVPLILERHFEIVSQGLAANVSTRMMADVQNFLPAAWERIERFRTQVVGMLTDLLRRGQQEGTIRPDIDPDTAGKIIQGVITHLANPRFLLGQDLSLGQFVGTFRKVLLEGILTRSSTTGRAGPGTTIRVAPRRSPPEPRKRSAAEKKPSPGTRTKR